MKVWRAKRKRMEEPGAEEAVAEAREAVDLRLQLSEMSRVVSERASEEEAVHRLLVVAVVRAQEVETSLKEIKSAEIAEMDPEVAVAEEVPARKVE